jgi:hypothetical protein
MYPLLAGRGPFRGCDLIRIEGNHVNDGSLEFRQAIATNFIALAACVSIRARRALQGRMTIPSLRIERGPS